MGLAAVQARRLSGCQPVMNMPPVVRAGVRSIDPNLLDGVDCLQHALDSCPAGGPQNGESDTTEFRTVAQSYRDNFGAQGYWSYTHLTTPNGPDDVNDLGAMAHAGLFRPEVRYEHAYDAPAYDLGTKKSQLMLAADLIVFY